MITIYKIWNNVEGVNDAYDRRNRNKKTKEAWQKILDSSESYTAEEWAELGISMRHWTYEGYFWHVEGTPESIVEELVNWKLGFSKIDYSSIRKNFPEDLIESRTDWDTMKQYADDLDDFIDKLYSYL